MRAGRFLCFNRGRIWGQDLVPVKYNIWAPGDLGCCLFWGCGSVVVDLLFLPLWGSMVVLCFVVRCFVSVLVLWWSWWGEGAGCFAGFVFLVSCGCCVDLPHGAVGVSAVCDCGIS